MGLKFREGDVLVPLKQDAANYLREIIVDAVDTLHFNYTIVDYDGDVWQASPIAIENEFKLKEGVLVG